MKYPADFHLPPSILIVTVSIAFALLVGAVSNCITAYSPSGAQKSVLAIVVFRGLRVTGDHMPPLTPFTIFTHQTVIL